MIPLAYSATGLPANLGIDANTGLISGTVALGAAANNPYTVMVTVSDGTSDVPVTFPWVVNASVTACDPAMPDISINSTSQNGCPEQAVAGQNQVLNGTYRVLAINDLGMHCGDLDTRISSILPPFQVLLGQVIQRGSTPTLNPAGVDLEYSSASNPNDPILGVPGAVRGLMDDGSTYKTNFWDAVAAGAYDAHYPAGVTPLFTGPFPVTPDLGLPVPNVEALYIRCRRYRQQRGREPHGSPARDAGSDRTLPAQHAHGRRGALRRQAVLRQFPIRLRGRERQLV